MLVSEGVYKLEGMFELLEYSLEKVHAQVPRVVLVLAMHVVQLVDMKGLVALRWIGVKVVKVSPSL